MKLNYRGINYDCNHSAINVTEQGVGGKFRGQNWRVHNTAQPLLIQKSRNSLTYRGVHYGNS